MLEDPSRAGIWDTLEMSVGDKTRRVFRATPRLSFDTHPNTKKGCFLI